MSTETTARTNPAKWFLVIGGALSAIVGAILWNVGNSALHDDKLGADYLHAIGLDNGVDITASTSAVDADQAMIWWGIALVILGVLMVLATVIIRAARR